ncbi:uncharacterized protein LOC110726198 [Chenopodium quinoa]|uniref:uncharacterized protein LOC110726198 n=1 Tax=Chenopodium quinoa TaxID=63459 RepID=UPI000B785F7E|nr:uncharacterized protein LOC110726198 [Chenopodium quinoa]
MPYDQVIQDKPNDEIMFALAMGPSKRVRTWSQFYVNGYKLQTFGHGKQKLTMNHGVSVSNEDGGDYFETTADIPTLCAPDDILDYEGDEDGVGDSNTDDEVLPDAPPDESSFESTDSDDEDEDDGFWDDDTDDDLNADGEGDSTEI